ALGVLQLGFVGLFSVIFAFVIEKPTLPTSLSSWLAVIFLSIFCTAAAFIIQTTALKYTTSVHAGLIFTFEPVIAAVIGTIFLEEVLTLRGYIGAILMLIGILIIEIDMDRIIRKYMNTKKEVEQ
ncbi:MAG: DMT family transporter, partial [Clostridia bacterium]|nr:DMT family transporter [Clostridia bacterium]